MSYRIEHLAGDIKRNVAMIIDQEINDPGIYGVSVVNAELSRDQKHAKVYVSIVGDDKAVLKKLAGCAGFVRSSLAKRMRSCRVIPDVTFVMDTSQSYYDHIDSLLRGLHKDD